MRARYIPFVGILLAALLARAADKPGFENLQKHDRATSADLLREFEAPAEQDYALGEGDEISVNVWGRPELTGTHLIGPDGNITLPYAGQIRFAGLTRAAAAQAALKALTPFYESLTVTVQVLKYESNKIFVLGRVSNPGTLHFDTQPTLLEAVTRAGGLPIGGIGADKAALARCMVFRGKDKLVWIDLRSLLNGADLALNIRLQRNDTLYIPDSDDQLVYVMGEVRKPGAVHMTPEMTFLNALYEAGGPTEDARLGNIRLVRPADGIEQDFNLADFTHAGKDPNVSLHDGDVIYVSRSGLGTAGYVFQKISPLTGLLLFGATLGR